MKLKGGNKNMRKTNRFVALLMALVLVFSSAMSTAVFAEVNEDVVGTSFEATVGKLKAVGIMEGYPDGTFKPEGEITRAEFAKIAVTALGLADAAEISRGTTRFPDVYLNHWATGFINVAVNRGLIIGYPNGTFQPEGKLTNAEAVTILVRLVGLGPVVDKQGTWPANYIGAASNEGILKGVNVASSTNALRGLTAEMLMNTLTVQKWGATGYDNDGSVSYGKLWDGETPANKLTLLNDNLGITEIEGRLMAIDDEEVTIGNTDYDYVGAEADEAWLFLNEVDAWQNDDDEIIYVVATSKQMFDAIEVNADGDELTLVEADKDYDIVAAPVVYISGDEEVIGDLQGNDYVYAKVVLNDDGDVAAVSAYNLDEYVVVDEVDGTDVIANDGGDLDVEDYTIVKNGRTIDAEDLEEGDILFYNENAEYADVYVKSVEGEITRIFTTSFRVGTKTYDYAGINFLNVDGDLKQLDADSAEDFQDGGEVALFLNRAGDAVFITGDLGEGAISSLYGYVFANKTGPYNIGRDDYYSLDVVNENGVVVEYDILEDDHDNEFTFNGWATGDVVKISLNSDGEIDDVEEVANNVAGVDVETDDAFVSGKKLSGSTVAFDLTAMGDEDDIVATTLRDAKFTEMSGDFYFNDKDEVVVIVVTNTDTDDVTEADAVATKNAVKVAGKNIWVFDLIVDGVKATYETKEDEFTTGTFPGVSKGELLLVDINDATGKIDDIAGADEVLNHVIVNKSNTAKTILDAGGNVVFDLKDAVILDAEDSFKTISMSGLAVGDTVDILLVAAGSRFAVYAVRTAEVDADTTAPVVTALLAAPDAAIAASVNHTLSFNEALNAASRTSVKSAVDAAYTTGGTSTVTSAWNAAGTTLTVTVTYGDTNIVLAAVANQVVTNLAGNTSAALVVQN